MASQENNAGESQLQQLGTPTKLGQAPLAGPGAAKIKELFQKGSRSIRAEQHQHWVNAAFLLGEQWLYYNRQTNALAELPRDPDRVQMTVNKLWPAARSLVSKIVSRPLVWDVSPTAADDATVRAAMTSESILEALTTEHGWEEVREEAVWAVLKGGTSAICVEWDPKAGREIGLTQQGVPFNEGDTIETALSIVDFCVEPGSKNAEKARWWIKVVALPPEEVQAMYDLPEKPQADASAALTPFQSRLLADHAGAGGVQNTDLTRVMTYYERPNGLNQSGSMSIVVGDQIVEDAAWPFPFQDRLNLVIIKETRGTGKWTGETIFKAARSIQMGINQSWSSIIEHMKLAGNARLFVPESVIDMMQEITDLPGEIVPYPDGQTPPQWTAPPAMPDWWIHQPEKLAMEMDEILGNHDVSRGKAPVNIESGVGLSILIDQDQSPVGRVVREIAAAWGKVGRIVLETYQEKVIETRQSVVQTPGQPAETAQWTGGNLLGQVNAKVPVDAIMPRNRAQQMEMAQHLIQMGVITTLEEFVTVTEVPDQRDLLQRLSPDVAKARDENASMSLGEPEPPATFDNHQVHIGEHLTFMKGARWRRLDPQTQEIFLLHNQAHENMDAENLGRQLAKTNISPVLGMAADKNGTPPIPPEALGNMMPGAAGQPGQPAAAPSRAAGPVHGANQPAPAATDEGKQIGNSMAMSRAARNDFESNHRPGTSLGP